MAAGGEDLKRTNLRHIVPFVMIPTSSSVLLISTSTQL